MEAQNTNDGKLVFRISSSAAFPVVWVPFVNMGEEAKEELCGLCLPVPASREWMKYGVPKLQPPNLF